MDATIPIAQVDEDQLPQGPSIEEQEQALGREEREALLERAEALLREKDAVLVAHYYTSGDLQELADATGGTVADSLEMARFGHEHPASTLTVAGVRFMGETAKILNPEKRVLMPSLEAECSLDLGCPADAFAAFCDEHPDRTVVVYANTSAAVKARADWVVTSSIAVDLIRHLHERGEKILFAPDRHLGNYIQRQTGADLLNWPGSCIVHDHFKGEELQELMSEHPEARVLVHPESPQAVIDQADVVGSTTQLIQAAVDLQAPTYIVATDRGIFHKMQEAVPGARFLEAPSAGIGATCQSCAHCPWMAMNGVTNLISALETGANEVHVDPEVAQAAWRPLKRMLDFNAERKQEPSGD